MAPQVDQTDLASPGYGTSHEALAAADSWNAAGSHQTAAWLPGVQKRVELSEEQQTQHYSLGRMGRLLTVLCAGCVAVVVIVAVALGTKLNQVGTPAQSLITSVKEAALSHQSKAPQALNEKRRFLRR